MSCFGSFSQLCFSPNKTVVLFVCSVAFVTDSSTYCRCCLFLTSVFLYINVRENLPTDVSVAKISGSDTVIMWRVTLSRPSPSKAYGCVPPQMLAITTHLDHLQTWSGYGPQSRYYCNEAEVFCSSRCDQFNFNYCSTRSTILNVFLIVHVF